MPGTQAVLSSGSSEFLEAQQCSILDTVWEDNRPQSFRFCLSHFYKHRLFM